MNAIVPFLATAIMIGQSGEILTQDKELPEPAPISTDQFVKLHNLIKPQPGELRFHEIPWRTNRVQCQAGNPILGRRRAALIRLSAEHHFPT